ncbi:MAG: methionyl-tRNA formyltransferase, partial [Alphaproteobacteria bacterium]|nr:methionyl-tRNA formyltransferase [Alphaproteobacteria bacterium]
RVFSKQPSKAKRGQKIQKSPVHKVAEELNIPISTPPNLKSKEILDELKSLDADIIVVVSYGHILRKNVLEMYKYGCLNIHPSLLPRWRGAAPIEHTILNGDTKTALCIMRMDEGVDTGDILLSEEVMLSKNETSKTLHEKMSKLGSELIVRALDHYPSLTPTKQSEEGIAYAAKLAKEDAVIDWRESADKIHRMIKTFNNSIGCTFILGHEKIKIFEAECRYTLEHGSKPGTILDNNFTIACGKGTLMPTILQKPGKKAIHIKDFLNGTKITPGNIVS